MIRRFAALAAGAILTTGLALTATTADATTLTCTHTAGATTAPIGCGGIRSATTAHGDLDLAVLGTGGTSGNFFNSPVGVSADSQSNVREDFTVFAVGGAITGGPGNLGEYVAMYTPNGKIPGFTTQPAPGSRSRRTPPTCACPSCSSPSARTARSAGPRCSATATPTARSTSAPTPRPATRTASPAATRTPTRCGHRSPARTACCSPTSRLSHHFHSGNTLYVLDIKGSGAAGSRLLAFPENDGLNQEWSLIGCTHPADVLSTGYQFCP